MGPDPAGSVLVPAAAVGDHRYLAVVDTDPMFRSSLELILVDEPIETFGSVAELEPVLAHHRRPVVVFGPSFANGRGLRSIQDLGGRRPDVGPVLVVERLAGRMLQAALRAGVGDVLALPVEETELVASIRRVAARRPVGASPMEPVEPGRVVTVFSAKGGAGTSVVATNLAVALARRSPQPVALVDADLQFGDAAVMLQLSPEHTIVDVLASLPRLDAQLLESLLVRHRPSGLRVLPAPVDPAAGDQVAVADMSKVVQALRSLSRVVVVDTPSVFNDHVLSLLEDSDEILLVSGLEIPHVKNLKLALQTLQLLNVPSDRVKVVVNRCDSRVNLDVHDLERTLKIKVDALVPSDVAVPASINKGVPVVLDDPRSRVTRALEELADLVVSRTAQPRVHQGEP